MYQPVRSVRPAVAAFAAFTVLAAAAVAGAATGPVFHTPSAFAGVQSMGVSYQVSVNGNFVPLPMDCLGEKRLLWYAPGAGADSLWRNLVLPAAGAPTFTSVPVTVSGTFQPFTGDFNGDGCEDVFWYAPGAAADTVWYFATSGTHVSKPVTVSGTFTPVVGSFAPGAADDIYWFAGAAGTEVIWAGTSTKGVFTSRSAPQRTVAASPVLAVDSSSIFFDAPGSTNDVTYRGIVAGSTSPTSTSSAAFASSAVVRNFGGYALRYVAGPGVDSLIVGLRNLVLPCLPPGPCPSSVPVFRYIDGSIGGTYTVSNSTARAGFGVLHGPGTLPDAIVVTRRSGVYFRQPAGTGAARPNSFNDVAAMSADGSTVVIRSDASNLVPGDTNGKGDVFVWNRTAGTYQRQPNGVGGAQPNGPSTPYAVSADGSLVVLQSSATNLVPGDTNGKADVFVWNRTTGTYQRQPLGVGGAQPSADSLPGAVSADGTKIAFVSTANNLVAGDANVGTDAFVWDRSNGTTTRQPSGFDGLQPTGSGAYIGGMSADGGRVLLRTDHSNLVPGDTNARDDVYLWDVASGVYTRQPLGVGGVEPDQSSYADDISADGTLVLLSSRATNLVAGDTNGSQDAFVWNTVTGRYTRQPLGVDGRQARTAAGSFVDTRGFAMSADGTKVVLSSVGANLTSGDTNGLADVFLWDTATGSLLRQPDRLDQKGPVLDSYPGVLSGPSTHGSAISADGTQIGLYSWDDRLAGGASNVYPEAYVWDRAPG